MATWREHMPEGMQLKSEGFASNLSAPDPASTLKAYCAAHGHTYDDQAWPVPVSLFNEYADWFHGRYVPQLESKLVVSLASSGEGYVLILEDGKRLYARKVVLAAGVTWFKHVPEMLAGLSNVSHSYDHLRASEFARRDVIVLGAGASAIDTAALFHNTGARTTILARRKAIPFHQAPDPDNVSWMKQLTMPPTGIGPGWKSVFFTKAPQLFRHLPAQLRLDVVKRYLGPAPGWFMRDTVEGRIPMMLGHHLQAVGESGSRIELHLRDERGAEKRVETDHLVAATGFAPSIRKLPFLSSVLREQIASIADTPVLSANFETSMPGLYALGLLAANSFGPLLRFMVGAEFAAPRLAGHLARKRARSSPFQTDRAEKLFAKASHIGLR